MFYESVLSKVWRCVWKQHEKFIVGASMIVEAIWTWSETYCSGVCFKLVVSSMGK